MALPATALRERGEGAGRGTGLGEEGMGAAGSDVLVLQEFAAQRPIFQREGQGPLRFHIHPSVEDAALMKDLVKEHGGFIVEEPDPHAILISSELAADQGTVPYSVHFLFDCLLRERVLELENYRLELKSPKKRPLSSFLSHQDESLFSYVLRTLDDGHYEPGEILFKKMEQEKVLPFSWQVLQERYHQLLEDPHYKKRKLAFAIERDLQKTPKKLQSPPITPTKQVPGEFQARRVLSPTGKDGGAEQAAANRQLKTPPQKPEPGGVGWKRVSLSPRDSASMASLPADSDLEDQEAAPKASQNGQHVESEEEEEEEGGATSSQDQLRSSQAKEEDQGLELNSFSALIDRLAQISHQPRKVVFYALYVCTGDFQAAREFLLKGPYDCRTQWWSEAEDEILGGSDESKIRELERKRGKQSVLARVTFLTGCL